MTLLEALLKAKGDTICRPFYKDHRQNDYVIAKYICTENGKDAWLEWKDTGNVISYTFLSIDSYSVRGHTDWMLREDVPRFDTMQDKVGFHAGSKKTLK